MPTLIIVLMVGLLLIGCSDPSDSPELFAGLGESRSQSIEAVPGYQITFPQDHKSHPQFPVEWWYLTANLFDNEGNHYPLQWTLFRFKSDSPANPWSDNQQYMAHAKVLSKEQGWFEERFARGNIGNAGILTSPFTVFLDDWKWQGSSSAMFPSRLQFNVDGEVSVDLSLLADDDFVLHGDQGFSIKLKNQKQASYYYSQPYIALDGSLEIAGKTIQVAGNGWFDHEWSSLYLDKHSSGWDWFSIHLQNGGKVMLFNMRHDLHPDFWSGTYIDKSGRQFAIQENSVEATITKKTDVSGRSLPLHWRISLLDHDIELQISPFKNDQWNDGIFSYYEGAIEVTGTHIGHGFIELTGY